MFLREENPNLFDAIVDNAWKNITVEYRADFLKGVQQGYIDDIYTESITELKLNAVGFAIESLKGIEHFRNLEYFVCNGANDRKVAETALERRAEIINNEKLAHDSEDEEKGNFWLQPPYGPEELREFCRKLINVGQLSDISALSSCRKLQSLGLCDQNKITEIDLSSFPYLKQCNMQRCKNLRTVNGLDELYSHVDLFGNPRASQEYRYDFSGSQNLTEIGGFARIVRKTVENKKEFGQPIYTFPVETCIGMTNHQKTSAMMRFYSEFACQNPNCDIFNWTENSLEQSQVGMTTGQVGLLKSRMDAIINQLVSPGDSSFAKVKKVYEWVVKSVKYDTEGFDKEILVSQDPEMVEAYNNELKKYSYNTITTMLEAEANKKPTPKRRAAKRIKEDEMRAAALRNHTMRSSFVALFNQKAVCVGISNLFNIMLRDMGMQPQTCLCHIKPGEEYENFGYMNHQISQLKMRVGKDKYTYFFDPTNETVVVHETENEPLCYFAMSTAELPEDTLLGPSNYDLAAGPTVYRGNQWRMAAERDARQELSADGAGDVGAKPHDAAKDADTAQQKESNFAQMSR